jgi:hypothetical protein
MTRRVTILLMLLTVLASAAGISGKWHFKVDLGGRSGEPVFVFEQSGEKLTGKYNGAAGEAPLTGTVKGDQVQFTFEVTFEGTALQVEYKGMLRKDGTMKGTADYGGHASGAWSAKRAQ